MTESIPQAVERMWPGVTFDYAMPVEFVQRCYDRSFDPRGQFVWGYPDGTVFGYPLPLTVEAVAYLLAP